MSSLSTIKSQIRNKEHIWGVLNFFFKGDTSLKVKVDFLTPSIFKNLVLSKKTHRCEDDSGQRSRLN